VAARHVAHQQLTQPRGRPSDDVVASDRLKKGVAFCTDVDNNIRQDYDLVRADYHAKRGRILRSNRRIEAIEPVLEYVGDLIDKDEAELRVSE